MNQQAFLRLAKRELGVTYRELAARLGVSPRSIEKWSLGDGSPDHRAMPLIAWKFVSWLLEDRKRVRLQSGDRRTAEAVDAIVSHVSAEKLRETLATFDALQRSASTFVPMTVARDKPRYFKTAAEKNAWSETEELTNARRVGEARAAAR